MALKHSAVLLLSVSLSTLPTTIAQTVAPAPNADLKQFQAVEDAWDAAVSKHDQYGLEGVLSLDYVDISATGDVTTRNQQVSRLFVQGREPLSLTQTAVTARTFGDTAVVNGTYVMEWPGSASGERVAEKGVFTHVFTRNPAGRWLCVNSQRTVVADQAEGSQRKAKSDSQSKKNSPLPMHVAPVYKGPQTTQPDPGTSPQ